MHISNPGEYLKSFVFHRSGSVIVNVNMSFYSVGTDNVINLIEALSPNSSLFREDFEVTSVESLHSKITVICYIYHIRS